MTVLTPSRETELDAFDLDLRVDIADTDEAAHDAAHATPGGGTWGCPTGPGVC